MMLVCFFRCFSCAVLGIFPLCLWASDTLKVVIVGDVMQHMPQVNSAFRNGVYDYSACFAPIKNEISSADLAIANLEVPLAGKPYSGYPQFSAPDDIAWALKENGFNMLFTANNHSCDKHAKGIKRTINILDSFKISNTGTFTDSNDRNNRYPLIIEHHNFRIALLNYTYSTNGIPVPPPFIVNLIDTAIIAADLKKARMQQPDLIIVGMHWGTEYARHPNAEQKMLCQFLFDHGVNIIAGAHPHVMQHFEKRYASDGRVKQVVAYSLGNFVSNQSQVNTDGGAIMKLLIEKDSVGIKITQVEYGLVWVHKTIENKKREYYILPAARNENNTDLSEGDQKKLKTFISSSRKLLEKENVGVCEYSF